MNLTIRPETPADVAAIEAVTAAAFLDAAHTSHTEHFIVNALRLPAPSPAAPCTTMTPSTHRAD